MMFLRLWVWHSTLTRFERWLFGFWIAIPLGILVGGVFGTMEASSQPKFIGWDEAIPTIAFRFMVALTGASAFFGTIWGTLTFFRRSKELRENGDLDEIKHRNGLAETASRSQRLERGQLHSSSINSVDVTNSQIQENASDSLENNMKYMPSEMREQLDTQKFPKQRTEIPAAQESSISKKQESPKERLTKVHIVSAQQRLKMNQRQRLIVSGAILLVILSGLFPPFEAEFLQTGDNMKKYMGYHFLFMPPTDNDVFEAFSAKGVSTQSRDTLGKRSSHIITSRLWIQGVTVIVSALGLLVLFSEKRNQGSSERKNRCGKL